MAKIALAYDIDARLFNPEHFYKTPYEVLTDSHLSQIDKIKILKRWEYDQRELMVAEEENMRGETLFILDEVLDALHQLGKGVDLQKAPPTKQGGE